MSVQKNVRAFHITVKMAKIFVMKANGLYHVLKIEKAKRFIYELKKIGVFVKMAFGILYLLVPRRLLPAVVSTMI